jgi:mannosyl-3-phosphoglycerate phosphatase
MKKLIVFTDLDGTLLNHDDYDYRDALPAIRRLQSMSVPVIFTSSKTLDELQQLADEIDIHDPIIHETGCGISWPDNYFPHLDSNHYAQCTPYATITALLHQLKTDHGFRFQGFNELSAAEISAMTGLSVTRARQAKNRRYGEPVQWQDTTEQLELFRQKIDAAGLHLVQGGRFIHVMSPVNKSSALHWLCRQYQHMHPNARLQTAGLGDSPNDRELLMSVDFAYLVRNLHLKNEQAQLMRLTAITLTKQCGAAGWNEAISGLLEDWE